LRIVPGRVKSDPERFVQIMFSENFCRVRLAVAVGVAQHFDLIGTTLHDEDVAIRRGQKKSRIAKTAGVQLDLKSRRDVKLSVCWRPNHTRRVNCQNV
jgi:hypothetical protein